MNGLLDSYYDYTAGPAGDGSGKPLIGVGGNFNVGSEVLRVQLGITGLILSAVVVLLLLHRAGNRYSVHV